MYEQNPLTHLIQGFLGGLDQARSMKAQKEQMAFERQAKLRQIAAEELRARASQTTAEAAQSTASAAHGRLALDRETETREAAEAAAADELQRSRNSQVGRFISRWFGPNSINLDENPEISDEEYAHLGGNAPMVNIASQYASQDHASAGSRTGPLDLNLDRIMNQAGDLATKMMAAAASAGAFATPEMRALMGRDISDITQDIARQLMEGRLEFGFELMPELAPRTGESKAAFYARMKLRAPELADLLFNTAIQRGIYQAD